MLDPAASAVTFTLDTTFHEVHGTMVLTAGTIRFDTETGEASGEITVDATRTATGNEDRDETMHAEVLETARYPTIVFRARRVEGVVADPGRSELRIVGVMSAARRGSPDDALDHRRERRWKRSRGARSSRFPMSNGA